MSARSQYFQAHRRVDDARGKARHHVCAWCGTQAAEWSYNHRDENQCEAEGYVWSDDPAHYLPMCHRDHRSFDGAYRSIGLADLEAAIAPLKAAAAQRLTAEQKLWHFEESARQSLIADRAKAFESHERFAKIDAMRAEKRAELERRWERAAKPADSLVGYLPMKVVLGNKSHRMTGVEAYGLYEDWCRAEHSTRILGRTQFYAALDATPGITRKRTTKGVEFLGLRSTLEL